MNSFTKVVSVFLFLILLSKASYSQQSAIYQRAADLCEAAAKKYDAMGCSASAAYCRKMRDWNLCMVNALAGKPNSCGIEPLPENAPKCDESANGGTYSGNNNSTSNPFDQIRKDQDRTQLEFINAQTAADNAYQTAIASGKKESGAMLDATLAASQQFSDPNAQLASLGVGLAASLFMHWGEKKQERLEREAALKREEERKQAIIDAKNKFITDALNINKYGFADLVSKSRYAALLLVRKNISSEQEEIYFTIPVLVPKYADSTYPLKDEIEKKLLKSLTLDRNQLANMKVYTLYPITDIKKFQNEFVKKMGSGHLIYLPAELIDFSNYPFNSNNENGATDFWGNPVKKENKTETNKPTKNDFWNN